MSYYNLESKKTRRYSIECTGTVIPDDRIRFTEAVFAGPWPNTKISGTRTLEAAVLASNRNKTGGEITFTLRVLFATGYQAPQRGDMLRRKSRNVYRNGTWRAPWNNESVRAVRLQGTGRQDDRRRSSRWHALRSK